MLYLANEVLEKTVMYPLTVGWLVVLCGIGMFFGSTYLLLSTNIGARLGFLVVGAVITAFICVLSVLWITTSTPLNVFKGRVEEWKPVSINDNAKSSNVKDVQDIVEKGEKLTGTDFANVKAAADTTLAPAAEGVEKPESVAADIPSKAVIVTDIYSIGGSNPNPLKMEFSHKAHYAVAVFCPLDEVKSKTAFRSTCEVPTDGTSNTKVLVLEKDLGTLRQPPVFLFIGSALTCAIFLACLHWREKDKKAKQAIETETPEVAEEEKETVDA